MKRSKFLGPVPANNEQYESLVSHRTSGIRLLRDYRWLSYDSQRLPSIVRHLADIQERLHLAAQLAPTFQCER